MIAKIQKWGNSLGVRIPKAFAEQVQFEDGTQVDVRIDGNHLLITALRKGYSLEALLKDVNPGNLHDAIDSGTAQGQESW